MRLKDIKIEVTERLGEGRIQHEVRSGKVDEKNFLLTGRVSIQELIELINATKGSEYSTSKHHLDQSIDVHIMKPKKSGIRWYIKFYKIEPDIWFISVHQ